MRALTDESIDEIFQYHAPDDEQKAAYEVLREEARVLARLIIRLCPPGPDQTVAIRKLRECIMTANACIALKGRY